MRHFDIVLFDLDGTLSNSKEGITKSVQYALAKFGIHETDLDKLEHFIGPPLVDEFVRAYNFSKEQAQIATATYRERYEPIGLYETSIYPDTEEMLQAVKHSGSLIGLATSKPQSMAEEVLRYLKIDQYFDYIMGAQKVGPRQSKTAVLTELLTIIEEKENTKLDLDNIVLVGDTTFDVVGANNVGISSIGVEYGFGDKEDMLAQGALCVVSSAKELADLLA